MAKGKGNVGLERAFGRSVEAGSSLPDPVGDAPGKVTVGRGTKGRDMVGAGFGAEASDRGTNVASGDRRMDNLGDAPGVVRVPAGTRGDHPANHPGKPGKADQGHTST